jgi:hypothetical protein
MIISSRIVASHFRISDRDTQIATMREPTLYSLFIPFIPNQTAGASSVKSRSGSNRLKS